MEEEQVDVVEAEALERGVDVRLALLVRVALREELRRDEELLARDAALADGLAHGDLVEVGVRRVDVAVARLERLWQVLANLLGGHHEDAVPHGGNPVPVVHRDCVHIGSFRETVAYNA